MDMIISAIVAVAQNNVIGKNGAIPWYLPADLRFFKQTTLNHHVIMGRRSFDSIGRPLPKRTNVVITRDPFFIGTGCIVAHSVEEALRIARDHGETEAFIIGGGEIYRQSMPFWDRLYLTRVDAAIEGGDAFFPQIDIDEWEIVASQAFPADEKNEFSYTFLRMDRITAPS